MSIDMDLAESGIIQKAFIKWRGTEIFCKICPSLIMWEPFKVSQRPLFFSWQLWKELLTADKKILTHGKMIFAQVL